MLIDHHSSTTEGFIYVLPDDDALKFQWSIDHWGQKRLVIQEVRIVDATVFPAADGSLAYRGKDRKLFRQAVKRYQDATPVSVIVTASTSVSRNPSP